MVNFPKRWPVNNPEVIQLYSLATPNGQKVSIMLEETGLEYEAHKVNIMENHQFDDDYLAINPNNKIPTLIDPDGPGGERYALMESGAILMYLAEKTGQFLPQDPARRWETIQWVMFQMGHVGPMLGQFGHFYMFAKDKTSDTYAVERYTKESRRIMGVLEKRLADREWILGDDYTIADMAIAPWIQCIDFYKGHDTLQTSDFPRLMDFTRRFYERPAVQTGSQVCGL